MRKQTKLCKQIFPLLLAVVLLCAPLTVQGATGVTLSQSSVSLKQGETINLQAAVTAGEPSTLIWSSSDPLVADVSGGAVTAKSPGSATITATAEDGSASCQITVSSNTVAVTGVTLSPSSLSLKTGEIAPLSTTVSPDTATNKRLRYSSSNSAVAEVNDSGAVYANSAGKATITVTTEDGEKTASCTVTVENPPVTVTGVTLDQGSLELKVGATAALRATIAPENAVNKNMSWGSSNSQVAAVDGNGTVTGKGEGTATITVTTGENGKTATCTVQVKAGAISVTGVSLSQTELSLKAGETATLTATIAPQDASNKNMSWTSSNTKVATVTANGTVTAKEAGTADITVTTTDGSMRASCKLTVPKGDVAATGVKLDKEKLALTVGKTAQMNATVSPTDATKKNVTWASSNETIATVDAKGLVTAKAVGTATITVKTEGGDKTASCALTITKNLVAVTGVTLDLSSLNLLAGKTATLTAGVQPLDATDVNLLWSSSNAAVATVENGKVTAVADGQAMITVKTEAGQKTATCTVTVTGGATPSPAPKNEMGGMFLWLGLGLLVLAIVAGIVLVLVIKRMKNEGKNQDPDDYDDFGDTGSIPPAVQNRSGMPYVPMDEGVEIDQSAFPLADYEADAAYIPEDEGITIDQDAFGADTQQDYPARHFQDMESGEIDAEIDSDDPTWRG